MFKSCFGRLIGQPSAFTSRASSGTDSVTVTSSACTSSYCLSFNGGNEDLYIAFTLGVLDDDLMLEIKYTTRVALRKLQWPGMQTTPSSHRGVGTLCKGKLQWQGVKTIPSLYREEEILSG